MKNKEHACMDWYEMIQNAWTWERLTKEEQRTFVRTLSDYDCTGRIKGSYDNRWEQCHMLYGMFLEALGYKPIGWREETTEETPKF